ncbi:hypothetical protein [Streptacidiphilus jiangxiensis]|uniref:Uncharacterized protein n=1 Tax=Streptacidiphilus jiangxiensis TaxID=235985 RepID=A0A1H7VHS1_STRJI|nr:hypothetical protein [Streptacidiphilus jiangxiensis]SEM08811.1 hypothetical protein SAMN05414137_11853 [Streptacidiphilus jiangxiensis]
MDAVRVTMLRELLADTPWIARTRGFAGTLRDVARPGGLLLVGTEAEEPWHLAAHLADEAAYADLPALSPVLVRHHVPPGAPAHLSVPLARLEEARRGETVFVVAPEVADAGLLERVHDARRVGATVLALEAADPELRGLAHEALTVVPDPGAPSFELVQHLVSAAAGDPATPRRPSAGLRGRLARLLDHLTAPPPPLGW